MSDYFFSPLLLFFSRRHIMHCRLGCNPIRDEGAEFLIDGIKNNKSLTKVWLV